MFLASPIWLVLLAPWAGLTIWILRGNLPGRGVPFLKLWRSETPQTRPPQRALNKPPVAVIALLTAVLVAILASTEPMVRVSADSFGANSPDVKIDRLAMRAGPTTQAMIGLTNQSVLSRAKLAVSAGGRPIVDEEIALPAPGGSRNYFVDIPMSAPQFEFTLEHEDGSAIAPGARAIRRGAWPIVEAASPLSPALQRMIEIYSRRRPSGEGSRRIAIAGASSGFAGDVPSALVLNGEYADAQLSVSPALTIYDSPVTRAVDWRKVLAGAKIASPPGRNWQPLIVVGEAAILAEHEEPARQIWVGFDSDNFPHFADFVVFWTNVFDALGEGGQVYETVLPAAAVQPHGSPEVESMAPYMLLAGLGMICFAAIAWRTSVASHANWGKS